jgi:glycosyltransferase involved in cell wall biosynthesis
VLELCRRLTKYFKIHILAPHAAGAQFETLFDGMRVTRYRYFIPRWEKLAYRGGILENLKQNQCRYALIPFFLLFQTLAIQKLLRRFPFDLIHAHWIIPQGVCAVFTRHLHRAGSPLLCTSHGGDLYGLNSKTMVWLKRRVLERAEAVTTVSRKMRHDVGSLGIDLGKIHVIPMGVDLQTRFVPSVRKKKTKSLLFVGRVVEKKGLRFLIAALPEILEKHPDAQLRVAGDGQELSTMKKLASDIGVAGQVHFLGAVTNEALPGLYQTSDVVVFPSVVATGGDREGFGLVLVEALGCECAVVATDLPASRDIIQDGATALVVRQKDARQIADKVVQLLNDPELRNSLGVRGRQHVLKRFDWTAISAQYTDLIHSVIRNNPTYVKTAEKPN